MLSSRQVGGSHIIDFSEDTGLERVLIIAYWHTMVGCKAAVWCGCGLVQLAAGPHRESLCFRQRLFRAGHHLQLFLHCVWVSPSRREMMGMRSGPVPEDVTGGLVGTRLRPARSSS